ncbi:MAG: DeoR/GlpR family DNA-binding transcription regulator [Oscillospiraceae bacterium]|jgi:DeoR/GlpR family transcriptional regulator of sugar metabolism|nr:DeoR/GlpR family DNA-binding transcription regulator [Oscillospiraceae bacterium]
MLNNRQNDILSIIEDKGDIQLGDLSLRFPDVSVMTLRRDLKALENGGVILRTRGGAVSVKKLSDGTGEENAYSMRAREHLNQKKEIAGKALQYVQKGKSMYFDSGSTIMALAEIMPDNQYSIITSGTNIAQKLVQNNKTSVMMLGGTVNANTLSVSGPHSISFIESVNIDLAFMSASAFSAENGFTVSNIYECELKRKVIDRAKKVIMLMDSGKFDNELLFTVSPLTSVDILVTDSGLPAHMREAIEKSAVTLI